jgi:hypothetical protein
MLGPGHYNDFRLWWRPLEMADTHFQLYNVVGIDYIAFQTEIPS